MKDIISYQPSSAGAIALPEPRVAVNIRQAVAGDLKFIDDLQRKHARMVGWFPTKQLETNIARGQVLIAEEAVGGGSAGATWPSAAPQTTAPEPHRQDACATRNGPHGGPYVPSASVPSPSPLGYCISSDRYFKRDDCGIVYQLNVLPNKHRGLIGATLIKAVFDRAAYGCKLFCCWCAQDLEANYFWESIGFVPLAFRTGSRKSGSKKEPRIHIFWQRRIREGDDQTPYWFPAETTGGAVRENRLVLPIPPDMHWSDAKPAILPGMERLNELPPAEEGPREKKVRKPREKKVVGPRPPAGGLWFAPPPPTAEEKKAMKAAEKKAKPKMKNDPKLVAAARELRDRYIEEINAGNLLPPGACGKYDVSRLLEEAPTAMQGEAVKRLEAA